MILASTLLLLLAASVWLFIMNVVLSMRRGEDAVRRRRLVLSVEGAPKDFLLPQADGSFLLRNYWTEMRFPASDEPVCPRATLRPLWFQDGAVVAERVTSGDAAR